MLKAKHAFFIILLVGLLISSYIATETHAQRLLEENEDGYAVQRREMVESQIKARGIEDRRVLRAMEAVPRHKFLPKYLEAFAYADRPLPIGEGQTISQPYIVALMTELMALKGDERVLEVGTGSGYQAAILSLLCKEVYTIEIIESLAKGAEERLKNLACTNVFVKIGNGYNGWPERSPYDAIMVTAAAKEIPKALIEQLKAGGRLVIPVGEVFEPQKLYLITKVNDKEIKKHEIAGVLFVPLRRE